MNNRYTIISVVMLALSVLSTATIAARTLDEALRLIDAGDIARARSVAQAAVNASPDDPEALVLLARLTLDGSQSQELYRRALSADPPDPVAAAAHLGIATYYYASGFYNNAHRLAKLVVESYPGQPIIEDAQLLMGRAQVASGRLYDALQTLEPLLTVSDPGIRQAATIVWAEASLSLGRHTLVAGALSDPAWRTDPYAMGLLARAQSALGRTRDAQNSNWRQIVARRNWENEELGATPHSVPVTNVPAVQQAGEEDSREDASSTRDLETSRHTSERYSLQIGAFGSRENAERLANRVREAGYEVTLLQTQSLFRVLVGTYSTRDDARAAMDGVRNASGQEPVIVQSR